MKLDRQEVSAFRELVWDFYRDQGRELPWRESVTPYGVFVSEIMLQQTQVARVLERWPRWLRRWPGFDELAAASTAEVLGEWQGMGYNRRALWLREAARRVVEDYGGELPRDPVELVKLPGVGSNTAGSMAAFAYGAPTVFIETNIRRVMIWHFSEAIQRARSGISFLGERTWEDAPSRPLGVPAFAGRKGIPDRALWDIDQDEEPLPVSDKELIPLIEATLDLEHPREWYWALMDYGADLARRVPNPNRRSRHYALQSRFEGSARQLRGEVLRRFLVAPATEEELRSGEGVVSLDDVRLEGVLEGLRREGMIELIGGRWRIAE